jgi:chemotaxis protein methyltransferase CheR
MACSDRDYEFLRDLVLVESANVIDPAKKALFETRLFPVAQLAGAASVEALVAILRVDPAKQLHRAVAEAMTINETSFFRDVAPFAVLRDAVLPRLIEQRRAQRKLRIWSAASSTGQEAYSLAILLCDRFPELARWDVKILGTDISGWVIDYARTARYRRLEVNRGLPGRLLMKYFQHEDEQWEVKPEVRRLCQFRQANLCEPLPGATAFDLILLRNVLLYFPQQDRGGVLQDVHRRLSPQGYLFLGNAEQAEDSTELFKAEIQQDAYYYRPVLAG